LSRRFPPGPPGPKTGNHPTALLGEADQFGPPLDEDPERLKPLDQQALMLVLREDV